MSRLPIFVLLGLQFLALNLALSFSRFSFDSVSQLWFGYFFFSFSLSHSESDSIISYFFSTPFRTFGQKDSFLFFCTEGNNKLFISWNEDDLQAKVLVSYVQRSVFTFFHGMTPISYFQTWIELKKCEPLLENVHKIFQKCSVTHVPR